MRCDDATSTVRMMRDERDCCQKPVPPPCRLDLIERERSVSSRAATAEAKERPESTSRVWWTVSDVDEGSLKMTSGSAPPEVIRGH
eukprot:6402423-Prymnesium_polylepis.1